MAAASHRGKGSTRSSDIRPTRLSRTATGAYRAHTARAGGARRGETDDDTGRDAHRPPRTPPKTPPPPRPPGRGRPDPDGGRGDTHPPVDTGRPAEGHAGGRAPLPGGERRPDGTEREGGGGGSLQDPHPRQTPRPDPHPTSPKAQGGKAREPLTQQPTPPRTPSASTRTPTPPPAPRTSHTSEPPPEHRPAPPPPTTTPPPPPPPPGDEAKDEDDDRGLCLPC